MSELAPIVLFLYNRPDHSSRTLDALAQNEEARDSNLFIYCDGPKNTADEVQLQNIEKVREIAHKEDRFKLVKVIENPENKGLAGSLISGITEVLNQFEKVIVIEDDILVAKNFLAFMNEALNLYEDVNEVICISGYTYPVKKKLPETFFIKVAECWGWATWKRGWDLLETSGVKLLKEIEDKKLTSEFDFDNSYPFTQMLRDQVEKKNDSWAILWYATALLKNKLCLYPGISLVQNIGHDGSGTHSGTSNDWQVKLADKRIGVEKIDFKEDRRARKLFSNYFKQLSRGKASLPNRVINKFRSLLKN